MITCQLSCRIDETVTQQVYNKSGFSLRKTGDHHAHGGFSEAPSFVLDDSKADVFGSQSKSGSLFTGTEGDVTYSGSGFLFTIHWDNPWAGGNSSSANVSGALWPIFNIEHEIGAGNEKAHARFGIYKTAAVYKLENFESKQWIYSNSDGRFGTFRGNDYSDQYQKLIEGTGAYSGYFKLENFESKQWIYSNSDGRFGTFRGNDYSDQYWKVSKGSPVQLKVERRCGRSVRIEPSRQLSSPFPLLAAVGARTQKIEIGTAVIDMRYENPYYMVEDAGSADLIAESRLQLGSSRRSPEQVIDGWRYFGYHPADGEDDEAMGRRHAEKFLELLSGTGFAQPNPRPMFANPPGLLSLQPHSEGLRDRIWWGAGSNATAVWAAKLGMNLQSSTLKSDETGEPFHIQQAAQIRAFRAAWKEAGHSRTPRVSVSRSIFALVNDLDRAYFGAKADTSSVNSTGQIVC